ncbi:uncharacterized protein [Haliotis cracherodii]|uniref:uncharacterized protein n=1 Tax=Haliotis cracherodii TaxID=6455 RepID=UPI0039E91EAA
MSDLKPHDNDSVLITYDIGAPRHTSTPLPKRRGVQSLTLPVADTYHHVPTLSSLNPMASPTYLQATCFSSPYSFFPPCSTRYYTPSFRPGSYMASSSPFLPLSPPFLPPSMFSPTFPPTQSLEFSSVPLSPCFLPSTQTRTFSSSTLSIQKVSDPSHPVVSTPSKAPVTPPCHLFKSVDASPVTETRPFDFQTPPCRRPNIGKAVDDIISKTLGKDPATTTTDSISDRQLALENRLQSLQSRFPAEVKELSSFLAFHSSSIQKEHQQCLHDDFFPTDYHTWLTNRYNDQLHLVLTNIERSLNTLENQDKRSRPASRNLNPESIILMETWYHEHLNNPYPTHTEAEDMAIKGGITLSQLRKWFSNKRHRTRRPRSVKARVASKHCEEFLSGIFLL